VIVGAGGRASRPAGARQSRGEVFIARDLYYPPKKTVVGGGLSAAAAPPSVRRRPAAARLVPTPTGCSRGAEAYRSGHDSRAAKCLLAYER